MIFNKSAKKVHETEFSSFIRGASAREKKKVYTEVLERASERQTSIIQTCDSGRRSRSLG